MTIISYLKQQRLATYPKVHLNPNIIMVKLQNEFINKLWFHNMMLVKLVMIIVYTEYF